MGSNIVAAAIVGALVAGTAARATQDVGTSDSLERPFVSNGRIRMDLSAGDYSISGAPAD